MSKVTFDVLANSRATGFDETNRKIAEQAALAKKTGDDSRKQYSALVTSAAALVSTIGPLGAAATAAMAGVASSAGVGLLAFQGLRKEWQQGTLQSTSLGKQITTLQTNITKLQGTAAAGVAPGLTAGLKSINGLMPAVNNDVKVLSGQLGVIAGNTGAAAVGLFKQMSPALEGIGASLADGSAKFKDWATNSKSVGNFAAYAQVELPVVAGTLTNIAVAGGHAIQALAPLGGSTLRAIDAFSGALRAIPIGTLETALPLLTGAFVGGRLGGQASQGLEKFAGKLGTIGETGTTTAKVMGGLGKVVSNLGVYGAVAGLALGGLGTIMGQNDKKAAAFKAQVNAVTEALQNGSAAQAAWVAAQNTGASAAKNLGLSQQQIIAQVEQGQKATGSYANAITDLKNKRVELEKQYQSDTYTFQVGSQVLKDDEKALRDNASAIDVLVGKASSAGKQFAAAKAQLADWAKAQGDAGLSAEIASGSYQKSATALFATQNAYLQGKLAADQFKISTDANTVAMQLENNAAGLLSQSLDKMGNQNASVLAGQTALATANNAVSTSFKNNKSAIDGSSAAALANQTALQGQHDSAVALATAIGKQTGSTRQEVQSLKDSKAALEDTLASQHRLTPAVQAYIDKLYNLKNLKLPPTKVDVDKAAADKKIADFKAKLVTIPGYRPTATVNANTNNALAKLKDIKDYLSSLNGTTAYTYVQTVVLGQAQQKNKAAAMGSPGHRASGGRVLGGHTYTVNELGQELYVRDGDGSYLIPGGPHQWKAPANGQIINAATVKGLKTKTAAVGSASLTRLPSAAASAISAVANVLPYGSPITKALQTEDKQLQALINRRSALATKLAAANQKLAATQQQYNQEFNTVKGGVLNSFNITSAGRDVFGNVSAGGLISDLQTKVSQAGLFASDLKALSGRLDKGLLQQLAEAGPEQSLATLQALMGATPAQLRQINTLQGRLGAAGTSAGTTEAKNLFGAQIHSQQALVKSLQSQEKSVDRLERALQAVLARSLKITINGGDEKTVIRALEHWVGIGGKLAISKGIR